MTTEEATEARGSTHRRRVLTTHTSRVLLLQQYFAQRFVTHVVSPSRLLRIRTTLAIAAREGPRAAGPAVRNDNGSARQLDRRRRCGITLDAP